MEIDRTMLIESLIAADSLILQLFQALNAGVDLKGQYNKEIIDLTKKVEERKNELRTTH